LKHKVLFVINPISGVGKQKTVETAVDMHINKSLIDYEFAYTQHAGHAETISRNAAGKYDIIVAIGGDGTVNEVSRALIGSDTALAIIPTGSGNGFARFLKIPLNVEKAVQLINELHTIQTDTASINGKSFVNVAGVGFDAHVAHRFSTFGRRGFFPYFWLVFSRFASYKSRIYTLHFSDKSVQKKAFVISIANSSQFGLNAHIAPLAVINDGLLNISVVRRFPIIAAPVLAARLFLRNFHLSKFVDNFTASKVTIETDTSTIEAHIDGEPVVLEGNISIELKPLSLNVIVPQYISK